jgi:hypothetical protein
MELDADASKRARTRGLPPPRGDDCHDRDALCRLSPPNVRCVDSRRPTAADGSGRRASSSSCGHRPQFAPDESEDSSTGAPLGLDSSTIEILHERTEGAAGRAVPGLPVDAGDPDRRAFVETFGA